MELEHNWNGIGTQSEWNWNNQNGTGNIMETESVTLYFACGFEEWRKLRLVS